MKSKKLRDFKTQKRKMQIVWNTGICNIEIAKHMVDKRYLTYNDDLYKNTSVVTRLFLLLWDPCTYSSISFQQQTTMHLMNYCRRHLGLLRRNQKPETGVEFCFLVKLRRSYSVSQERKDYFPLFQTLYCPPVPAFLFPLIFLRKSFVPNVALSCH